MTVWRFVKVTDDKRVAGSGWVCCVDPPWWNRREAARMTVANTTNSGMRTRRDRFQRGIFSFPGVLMADAPLPSCPSSWRKFRRLALTASSYFGRNSLPGVDGAVGVGYCSAAFSDPEPDMLSVCRPFDVLGVVCFCILKRFRMSYPALQRVGPE